MRTRLRSFRTTRRTLLASAALAMAGAALVGAPAVEAQEPLKIGIVRAFNCIPAASLAGQANRQPERIAIPIGGDDAAALLIAERLVRDAGFDPVVVGSLAETRQFDLGQPLAQGNLSAAELRARMDR